MRLTPPKGTADEQFKFVAGMRHDQTREGLKQVKSAFKAGRPRKIC